MIYKCFNNCREVQSIYINSKPISQIFLNQSEIWRSTSYTPEVLSDLVMTSTKGVKCKFTADNLYQPLTYKSMSYVNQPFSLCSEISNYVDLLEVKDYSNMISSIGNDSFYDCINLTAVSFPNVLSIGENAFGYCAISKADFPQVKTITYKAFESCEKLKTVEFPNTLEIGNGAFAYCTELLSIRLDNIKILGLYGFENCTSLKNAIFSSAKSIQSRAFLGCSSLENVFSPQVSSIGSQAFDRCESLKSIVLSGLSSSSSPVIYNNSFGKARDWPVSVYILEGQCSEISADQKWQSQIQQGIVQIVEVREQLAKKLDVTIRNGTKYSFNSSEISNPFSFVKDGHVQYPFNTCSALSEISNIIEVYDFGTIIDIDAGAFENCTSLVAIKANFASRVRENSFKNCSNLQVIELRDVSSISQAAFVNCSRLSSVLVDNSVLHSVSDGYGNNDVLIESRSSSLIVAVPSISQISNDSIICIEDSSLCCCSSLNNVIMSNVKYIKQNAFDSCISLSSISMPSLESIGRMAFNGCSSLQSISVLNEHDDVFISVHLDSFGLQPKENPISIFVPYGSTFAISNDNVWKNLLSSRIVVLNDKFYQDSTVFEGFEEMCDELVKYGKYERK